MMTPPQKDRNWDLKPIPPQEEAAPEELHRNPACEAVRDAHKLQDACANERWRSRLQHTRYQQQPGRQQNRRSRRTPVPEKEEAE